MTGKRRLLTALLLLMAIGANGCASSGERTSDDDGYTVLVEPTIVAGDDIPAPEGDVVLTISGEITTTNVGDQLELDMATLERMGLVEYEVDDQQAEGRVVVFQGVLLSDLLAVAGAAMTSELEMTALNDYAVSIPADDAVAFPVLLATQADGEPMSVADYGPTRIIYPYESEDLDRAIYDPRWIWQLASIDVR